MTTVNVRRPPARANRPLGLMITTLLPRWLQAVWSGNPLSYVVAGLRGILVGTWADIPADIGVLARRDGPMSAAAALLPRPVRGSGTRRPGPPG